VKSLIPNPSPKVEWSKNSKTYKLKNSKTYPKH